MTLLTSVVMGPRATVAEAPDMARWVHGSWVNVRDAGHAKAPVLTHLVANTPVRLLAVPATPTAGEAFCHIAWSGDLQGWIACALLGTAPLRIEDVADGQTASGAPNPSYSPLRAFWLQPSLDRLGLVAEHLVHTRLSPQQQAAETVDERFVWERRPPLKRPEVPEFEAMKALLRQGVVEPTALHPEPGVDWPTLKRAALAAEHTDSGAIEDSALLARLSELGARFHTPAASLMLRQIELPVVQASLLASIKTQLGPPTARAERLSAQFQRPYAVRFLGKPEWQQSEPGGISIQGWWDVGNQEVALLAPLHLVQLSADGVLTQRPSRAGYTLWGRECTEGYRHGGPPSSSGPAPGLADLKGTTWPLVQFYSPTAWPSRPASVQLSPRVPLVAQHPKLPRYNAMEVVHQAQWLTLDLDHDGQPDLLVWEGWRPDAMDHKAPPRPNLRLVFANETGRWSLLYVDEYFYCDD